MIEIDPITPLQLARLGHHLLGLGDVVGDRFFAKDMTSRFKRLDGRREVIAAVLVAAGRDAAHMRLQRVEHLLRIVKAPNAQPACRHIDAILADIANADEFRQRIGLVQIGVAVPDRPHADDAYAKHIHLQTHDLAGLP